jgi:hypothetical protein
MFTTSGHGECFCLRHYTLSARTHLLQLPAKDLHDIMQKKKHSDNGISHTGNVIVQSLSYLKAVPPLPSIIHETLVTRS